MWFTMDLMHSEVDRSRTVTSPSEFSYTSCCIQGQMLRQMCWQHRKYMITFCKCHDIMLLTVRCFFFFLNHKQTLHDPLCKVSTGWTENGNQTSATVLVVYGLFIFVATWVWCIFGPMSHRYETKPVGSHMLRTYTFSWTGLYHSHNWQTTDLIENMGNLSL